MASICDAGSGEISCGSYRESRRGTADRCHQFGDRGGPWRLLCRAGLYLRENRRIAKTHSGVQGEFSRLAKDDPLIARSITAFLPHPYRYKEIGDYDVKLGKVITMERAEAAIVSAEQFIASVRAALQ